MDKIFNKTKKVLEGIATKLSEALMTVQGWLIGLLIVIVNFFAGYQLVLYGVLIAVAFDALFGICVARKRRRIYPVRTPAGYDIQAGSLLQSDRSIRFHR